MNLIFNISSVLFLSVLFSCTKSNKSTQEPVVATFEPTKGKFVKYDIESNNSKINFQIMKFKIGAKVGDEFNQQYEYKVNYPSPHSPTKLYKLSW